MKLVVVNPLENNISLTYSLSLFKGDDLVYVFPHIHQQSVVFSDEANEEYKLFHTLAVQRSEITETDLYYMIKAALDFYPELMDENTDQLCFDFMYAELEQEQHKQNARYIPPKADPEVLKFLDSLDLDNCCIAKDFAPVQKISYEDKYGLHAQATSKLKRRLK